MHYRVYESGFGKVGDRFVVVISAKTDWIMLKKVKKTETY